MTNDQYEAASSFWIKKDAESKHMDDQELYERIDHFLSEHKVLALACGDASFIRCTPLEYTWHDGALWIFSEGGLKFRALQNHPHVSAAVFESNMSFGSLLSCQIQGQVEMVDLFSKEYMAEAFVRHIPAEMLKKLPEPMWLLKIIPDEMTLLDSSLKKEGYGSRQTWKR